MHSTSEELPSLAQPMGQDKMSSRTELEAKLAPLLSLVLQTGLASPSLLQWVRLTLPAVAPSLNFRRRVDLEWAALHLARLLCWQLHQDICAQRDSLVNHQTVVER
ncbi:MAG TPA: hypothetical protein VH592_11110 [Gemmataceae bacterium]|jgi:hypothetical protein